MGQWLPEEPPFFRGLNAFALIKCPTCQGTGNGRISEIYQPEYNDYDEWTGNWIYRREIVSDDYIPRYSSYVNMGYNTPPPPEGTYEEIWYRCPDCSGKKIAYAWIEEKADNLKIVHVKTISSLNEMGSGLFSNQPQYFDIEVTDENREFYSKSKPRFS